MKKIRTILFFTLLFFASAIIVTAHSGRTDSNGGHYDSSTGEYHYHHGHPAHQHKNGICPYDYDDDTNHNSSNSKDAPWYVYVIVIAIGAVGFLLDLKLDGKITMFFLSLFFHIMMFPLYIVGLVQLIIDKIKNNKTEKEDTDAM